MAKNILNHGSSPMLPSGLRLAHRAKGIRHYTNPPTHHKVPVLENGTVDLFRERAFLPALPATLPPGHFAHLPAVTAWFTEPSSDDATQTLNHTYLSPYGDTIVPLELTSHPPTPTSPAFRRFRGPLHLLLNWTSTAPTSGAPYRLYLAQAQVADLPPRLRADVPVPDLVRKAGKGDVYDANVWIGLAPTSTPLHRDPNPNLFVQLAGTKVVRLFEPAVGAEMYARVGAGEGVLRGEEMMQGEERRGLEGEVWGGEDGGVGGQVRGFEPRLGRGDGLFIPRGWWHSVRGVGGGVTGSVS